MSQQLGRIIVVSPFEHPDAALIVAASTVGGIWELMCEPARASLAQAGPRGFAHVENPGCSTATIDYLMRRYQTPVEADAADGAKQLHR